MVAAVVLQGEWWAMVLWPRLAGRGCRRWVVGWVMVALVGEGWPRRTVWASASLSSTPREGWSPPCEARATRNPSAPRLRPCQPCPVWSWGAIVACFATWRATAARARTRRAKKIDCGAAGDGPRARAAARRSKKPRVVVCSCLSLRVACCRALSVLVALRRSCFPCAPNFVGCAGG